MIAGVFELFGIERADPAIGEQLREADDVGQRRAQLVGDVLDEIVAQFLRADQRMLRSVSARSTLALAVTSKNVSSVAPSGSGIAAHSSTRPSLRSMRASKPRRASGRPTMVARSPSQSAGLVEQRRAKSRATSSICGRVGGVGGIEAPQRGEGGIDQLHPPVRAEHGDAFLQRVERLALHAGQRVELRGEREALRRVVEEVGDAALRIGAGHDAQRAPVGQVPDVLDRVDRLIGRERLRLPGAEVGLLGQLPLGAQSIEHFAVGRLLIEEGGVERPDLAIGGVVEDQPLGAVEDRHRRRQLIEHARIGADVALHLGAQRARVRKDRWRCRRRPFWRRDLDHLEQLALAGRRRRARAGARRPIARAPVGGLAASRDRTVRARVRPPRRRPWRFDGARVGDDWPRRSARRRRASRRDWGSRRAARGARRAPRELGRGSRAAARVADGRPKRRECASRRGRRPRVRRFRNGGP